MKPVLVDLLRTEYGKPPVPFDDGGDLAAKVQRAMGKLAELHERSLTQGICVDCEAKFEGVWAGDPGDSGWRVFYDTVSGKPVAVQCPACDAAEKEDEA